MIQPINGNFLIKPIAQKSLFSNGKYEEMGTVIRKPKDGILPTIWRWLTWANVKVGDRVFFDSWLCSKHSSGEQDENGEEIYFRLVNYKDLKADDKNEIPE